MRNIEPSIILAIEHDVVNIGAITEALKELNYGIAIARTGATGIEQAKALRPDLILANTLMPDMNGLEIYRQLKADDATRPIPVVFLPVSNDNEDSLNSFDLKKAEHLTKPTQPEEILAQLSTHLAIQILQQKFRDQNGRLREKNEQLQREIFQYEQAEKRLCESEQRYRAVAEDQTELICRFSLHGTLVFVNQAYCRYFGKNSEELIGESFFRFIPKEDRKLVHKYLANLSQDQPVGTIEHRVLRPDGEIGWQQWTNRIIVDDQGRTEFQAVGRDITEQKRVEEQLDRYYESLYDLVQERTAALTRVAAETTQLNNQLQQEIVERKRIENALRMSEQQYRALAEHMTYGMAIMQEGQIVFVNTPLTDILNSPRVQVLKKSVEDLFDQASPEEYRQKLRQVLQRELKEFTRQAQGVNGAGEEIWLEGSHTFIEWHRNPAVLITVRDITDQKRRELAEQQKQAQLEQENTALRAALQDRYKFGEILGKSPGMQEVYHAIMSAAKTEASVLICGESGTGKELAARTIHQMSARHDAPFVAVNCGAVPEHLFEREFFGNRKGAFTGADRDRPGYFDQAHKGTLFLDEVGELKPELQVKLLRVLEDNQYLPVGGTISKKADVRIISATNKDLKEQLRKGLIRKDFFYRIRVIVITLPPLRDRKEDIPLLVDHCLKQYGAKQECTSLPAHIIKALGSYDWPGNVRELQNELQRYLAERRMEFIGDAFDEPQTTDDMTRTVSDMAHLPLSEALEIFEKRLITHTLARNQGYTGKAAAQLGISARTLQRKMKYYKL